MSTARGKASCRNLDIAIDVLEKAERADHCEGTEEVRHILQ